MYNDVNCVRTMSLDNYNIVKVIGEGSYGQVWLSKHKMDKKQVQSTAVLLLFVIAC